MMMRQTAFYTKPMSIVSTWVVVMLRKVGFGGCFLGCPFPTALDGQRMCVFQTVLVAHH